MSQEPPQTQLPAWAQRIRDSYTSATASLFLLHGVRDRFAYAGLYLPLPTFLHHVFCGDKVTVVYDIGAGFTFPHPSDENEFRAFLADYAEGANTFADPSQHVRLSGMLRSGGFDESTRQSALSVIGAATQAGADLETVLNGFGLSLGGFTPAGCQAQNDFDQDRTSKAIYADTKYEFTDALTLRLGLRYTEDESELSSFSARLLGNDDVPLLNTIPGDPLDPFAQAPDDDFTDREWTGKLGIDYTTAAGTLLYASYSHGYRNGAFNAQAFFDQAGQAQALAGSQSLGLDQ